MSEIPLVFGAERHLIGTLTLPEPEPLRPVGVVLFNAGVVQRIGPHRINVKVARHLASLGFASMRFDLSGQGDSRSSSSSAPYRAQAIADLKAAMDHMERTAGVRYFLIFGICSGADHGVGCALEDDRVVGLWMLDPYAYPTSKTRWLLYRRKFKQRGVMSSLQWLAGRMAALPRRALALLRPTAEEDRSVDYGRHVPPAAEFAASLQTLVDRGVGLFLVYSGSLLNTYNYPEQFNDVFGGYRFARQVRCEFAPQVDHTVTPLTAQRQVLEWVGDWAQAVSDRLGAVSEQRNAA
jgi:hypothetical protein